MDPLTGTAVLPPEPHQVPGATPVGPEAGGAAARGGARCRPARRARAHSWAARTPRPPAAGAAAAGLAPAARTAPAPSAATTAGTVPGSGPPCSTATQSAAVLTPAVRTMPAAPVPHRPQWPITGRSPVGNWLPVAWTLMTPAVAEGCVAAAMPGQPPVIPGPGEDGTPRDTRSKSLPGRLTGPVTDRPGVAVAGPRGGAPETDRTEQASEGRFRAVRFWSGRIPRRPELAPA